MTATTMRTALERLICNHGYDADHKTCQCVSDGVNDEQTPIRPISVQEHAAHVVNRIFGILDGTATPR